MTQKFDHLTRTVENKTLLAWELTITPKSGISRTVYALGNDISKVIPVAEKYHQGKVTAWTMCPARDIRTESLATDCDKMDSHWAPKDGVAYPIKQWQNGAELADSYDYIALSYRSVWSAGVLGALKSVFSCERIGFHAHTQALVNGMIESGLPILDFRHEKYI